MSENAKRLMSESKIEEEGQEKREKDKETTDFFDVSSKWSDYIGMCNEQWCQGI